MTSKAYQSAYDAVAAGRLPEVHRDEAETAGEPETAAAWPLCGVCELPVVDGERVVAYPTGGRIGYIAHGACYDALRATAARLLAAEVITSTEGVL